MFGSFSWYNLELSMPLIYHGFLTKPLTGRKWQPVLLNNYDQMSIGSICSFMRFPRVSVSKTISVDLNSGSSEFPHNIEIPTIWNADDISHLEKLITVSSGVLSDDMLLCIETLLSMLHILLLMRG